MNAPGYLRFQTEEDKAAVEFVQTSLDSKQQRSVVHLYSQKKIKWIGNYFFAWINFHAASISSVCSFTLGLSKIFRMIPLSSIKKVVLNSPM